jgi:hypothetical protein
VTRRRWWRAGRAARARRGAACAGAAALLAAALAGCFFDTRTPEDSGGSDTTATRWKPAITPAILVSNIEVTFEDRQIDFYRRAFRTDFLFQPDFQDSLDYATQGRFPFAGWDASVEEQVTEIVMNTADKIALTFSSLSPPDSVAGADTVRIRKTYAFSLVNQDSVDGALVTVDSAFYKGTATFYMRNEAGDWALYRWGDTRPGEPELSSWGRLRAETRP